MTIVLTVLHRYEFVEYSVQLSVLCGLCFLGVEIQKLEKFQQSKIWAN